MCTSRNIASKTIIQVGPPIVKSASKASTTPTRKRANHHRQGRSQKEPPEFLTFSDHDHLYLNSHPCNDDHQPHNHYYNAHQGEDHLCRTLLPKVDQVELCRSPIHWPSADDPGWTAKHHARHFVHHNYHDHSQDTEECPPFVGRNSPVARGGVVTAFPVVLHSMLGVVEEQGLSHIVSWQPHGRAFAVHEASTFVKKVMPMFFRQSKISSFQRQLNLYGFCRLTGKGSDQGAYYNEYFLRGRADLASKVHRTRIKGTGIRTSSNPADEPNFYEMEPVGLQDNKDHSLVLMPQIDSSSNKDDVRDIVNDLPQFKCLEPLLDMESWKVLDVVEYDNEELELTSISRIEQESSQLLSMPLDLVDVEDASEMARFLSEVDLLTVEITQFNCQQEPCLMDVIQSITEV